MLKGQLWRLWPLLLFSVLVVFLWRGLSLEPARLPSQKINSQVPDFSLPGMSAQDQALTAQVLRGTPLLLNIWATWCESCHEEQVFLLQLSRQGVPIYGLNYKDDKEAAAQWLARWGNPYQRVGFDREGRVAMDLGVYGTPETFLIDQTGIIRYRHAGLLDERVWQREFLPRIEALERRA